VRRCAPTSRQLLPAVPCPADQNISEQIVGAVGAVMVMTWARMRKTVPYVAEHTAMAASIRGDGPYVNHGMTVAESTMTSLWDASRPTPATR